MTHILKRILIPTALLKKLNYNVTHILTKADGCRIFQKNLITMLESQCLSHIVTRVPIEKADEIA